MVSYQLNPKFVEWESEESYIFINRNLSKEEQQLIKINHIPKTPGIIWVGSSGTTTESSFKLVALPKKSFLNSAKSVCEHLKVTNKDIWLNVLPRFHVGGLSIEARAFVSGCKVNLKRWDKFDATDFAGLIEGAEVSITSLVPAQIFELVKNNIKAPKSLRVALVGGGHLSDELYKKIIQLGWPVVLTYGMTEASSSVATSELTNIGSEQKPPMHILPHLKAKVDESGQLSLSGNSLLAGTLVFSKKETVFHDNNKNWYETSDLAELNNNELKFISRKHQQIKISGELVNVNQLNNSFEKLKSENNLNFTSQLVVNKNVKYGNQLDLAVEGIENLSKVDSVTASFNSIQPKHQKIRSTYYLKSITKSPLGKLTLKNLI